MSDATAIGIATTIVGTLAGVIAALYLRLTREHDRAIARIAQLEKALDDERTAASTEAHERVDFMLEASARVHDELTKVASVAEAMNRAMSLISAGARR